jgi:hypothetical protein
VRLSLNNGKKKNINYCNVGVELKMKNVVYRYTIFGNYATDFRNIAVAVEEGNGLMVNSDLQRDEIIGGVCKEIKEDTLELIYEIWEVDENKFKHPSVSSYKKVEIEVESKLVKLPPGKPKKIQWKSGNKGGNGKNVTLNPKPSNVTKNPGPVRFYESIEENGFTRLNKPKKSSPKGTIVGIITGV